MSMYDQHKYIMSNSAGILAASPDDVIDLVHEALVKLIENVSLLMELEGPRW